MPKENYCAWCGELSTLRCAKCQQMRYCSQECQRAHWSTHKIACKALDTSSRSKSGDNKGSPPMASDKSSSSSKSGDNKGSPSMVRCIRMRNIHQLTEEDIPSTDSRFDKTDSRLLSPMLARCNIPLLVLRTLTADPFTIPRTADLDNQPATYFMADVKSGLAPPHWQQNVGEVLLMRKDRRNLTRNEVFGLWDFFCKIMDDFGDPRPPNVNRTYFERWQTQYNEDQHLNNPAHVTVNL